MSPHLTKCPWKNIVYSINVIPMYARKQILPNNSYSHVFFRCHNRLFFLKPHHVKDYLLSLWAKFKKRYGVKIYEFIILDNHAHLLVKAESTEALGHFMRTVNSLLARYINKFFKRDSQAIRERYKSPLIASMIYAQRVMQYIWLNRHKIDKSNPLKDPYCSASWRVNKIIPKFDLKDEEQASLSALLDFDALLYPSKLERFVQDLLNAAIGNLLELEASAMVHGHTIGDKEVVTYRSELMATFRRQRNPCPSWV